MTQYVVIHKLTQKPVLYFDTLKPRVFKTKELAQDLCNIKNKQMGAEFYAIKAVDIEKVYKCPECNQFAVEAHWYMEDGASVLDSNCSKCGKRFYFYIGADDDYQTRIKELEEQPIIIERVSI